MYKCHEIFYFRFYSRTSFRQAPEYTIKKGPFLIFFDNSCRYSQLKGHHRCHWHRWQMKKIFNQKSNFKILFFFKFTLRCKQPDIVPIICHQCFDTGGKFATRHPISWLVNISVNWKWPKWYFSGAWGKIIYEEKKPEAENFMALSL